MKILHVTRSFSPALGGLEDAVQNLATHQRRAGLDVKILTLNPPANGNFGRLPAEDVINGVPVQRIPWFGSSRYPIAPGILNSIEHCDLLHVHAIDFFFDFLAWSRPFHHCAIVASTHGGFFHTKFMQHAKRIWFHTMTRASTSLYHGIIASSESDASMFARLHPRLLQTIENGVDIQKWSGYAANAPTKNIITFGRFASHKRIDLLFDILRALHALDPSWHLTIAGSPADVSEDELRRAGSGLDNAFRIVVRPEPDQLGALIAQSSYFACASTYEGFGIAAVEAMSAGLIPLLSPIPPFVRLANKTDGIVLFDPSRPAELAARLVQLHADLQSCWRERTQSIMDAARTYDWNCVAASHLTFYEKILREDFVQPSSRRPSND